MASNAVIDFKVYPLSLILELLVFVAFATVGFLALLLYMNSKTKTRVQPEKAFMRLSVRDRSLVPRSRYV